MKTGDAFISGAGANEAREVSHHCPNGASPHDGHLGHQKSEASDVARCSNVQSVCGEAWWHADPRSTKATFHIYYRKEQCGWINDQLAPGKQETIYKMGEIY